MELFYALIFFSFSFLSLALSINQSTTPEQNGQTVKTPLDAKPGNQNKKNAVYLIIQIRYMCCISQKGKRKKKILSLKQLDKSKKSSTGHRYRCR